VSFGEFLDVIVIFSKGTVLSLIRDRHHWKNGRMWVLKTILRKLKWAFNNRILKNFSPNIFQKILNIIIYLYPQRTLDYDPNSFTVQFVVSTTIHNLSVQKCLSPQWTIMIIQFRVDIPPCRFPRWKVENVFWYV
jgi:hypothetical protein